MKELKEEEEEEVASTKGGWSVTHAHANGQMSGKWADGWGNSLERGRTQSALLLGERGSDSGDGSES